MTDERSGGRVLLAEDSPFARREIARELLAVEGVANVVTVGSVREARTALKNGGFEVCVLDFHLGDGTALDILRDRETLRHVPRATFIVLTASPSAALRRRCLAAGADHFFAKPDEMQELRDLMSRLAARSFTPPGPS